MSPGLQGKRIFLTGATGFIGSRLAQCLTSAYGAGVQALVRRVGTVGSARLARLAGVRMVYGDILDPEAVNRAAEGCSVFVHCAIGTSGNPRQREKVTIEGTRTVLDAACRQQAERFLYLSSASVHDPARSAEVIREECPVNGRDLARQKVLAERLVRDYQQRHGLPVVIVRPTCVWGPFSPVWTVSAVQLIRQEIPFLPMEGRGVANLVYIDNLVDAVVLALMKAEALGQTFLINDDEPGTWGQLYGAYAQSLNVSLSFIKDNNMIRNVIKVSLHNCALIFMNILRGKTTLGPHTIRELYDHVPVVKLLVSHLSVSVQDRLKGYDITHAQASKHASVASRPRDSSSLFHPFVLLSPPMRELYEAKSRYSSEKAKRLLGWKPRLTFPRSSAVTIQWLKYPGCLGENVSWSRMKGT